MPDDRNIQKLGVNKLFTRVLNKLSEMSGDNNTTVLISSIILLLSSLSPPLQFHITFNVVNNRVTPPVETDASEFELEDIEFGLSTLETKKQPDLLEY
ncbi:hypothetical protein [Okeania sp. KiyG1]|uniref:hypothetical protein n=1 Tax=Okeania sp. KiyG1 TaxID=2720165 RepID=UPI001922A190|nr:hypothetical protein [Okeania sp. KiyG1]GGA12917.1 hypothetical protein CYANOKiyG1_26140 [Okeania sp. KiyG1]